MADLNIQESGARGFLLWLKHEPATAAIYAKLEPKLKELIAQARKKGAASFGGLGDVTADFMPTIDMSTLTPQVPVISDTSTAPASGGFVDTLKNLISTAGTALLTAQQLKTAQKVTDMQLQRAQQGLPPLSIDTASLGLPQVGVQVGVSKGTQTMLLWGAGLLAAVLILPRLLRGR
jgi:hypothetical protein